MVYSVKYLKYATAYENLDGLIDVISLAQEDGTSLVSSVIVFGVELNI